MANWYYKETNVKNENGHKEYIATPICSVCGKEYQSKNAPVSKYCPNCVAEAYRIRNRERVRRFRERMKENNNTMA